MFIKIINKMFFFIRRYSIEKILKRPCVTQ